MQGINIPFKAAHNGAGRRKERRHYKSILRKEFHHMMTEAVREAEEQMWSEFNKDTDLEQALEEYRQLTTCHNDCAVCKYVSVCQN